MTCSFGEKGKQAINTLTYYFATRFIVGNLQRPYLDSYIFFKDITINQFQINTGSKTFSSPPLFHHFLYFFIYQPQKKNKIAVLLPMCWRILIQSVFN